MAAALFNAQADPLKARAISAGTAPGTRVHPEVVDVMRQAGLDLSSQAPQLLTDDLARGAQWLITMGCGDQCPVVPGIRRDDWPIPDPKGQPPERVQAIKSDIETRVRAFVDEEGWTRR
jgi:arsenate reductase